jgi:predicted  nucleic acid-binding Zn-ribbon protein
MIEALKQDLQTLSDSVPLLASKISEAKNGAEALVAAAEELQHQLDTAHQEATLRLTTLHDGLPGLVTQEEKQLKDADQAVIDAWHAAESLLKTSGESVVTEVAEVLAQGHNLGAALAKAGTQIDQSQAAGEAALNHLEQVAHDAEERLRAALQAVQAEVANFKTFSDEAKHRMVTAAQALWSRLGTATADAQSGAQEALQAIHAKGSALKETTHDLLSTLGEQVMEKVDGADGQIDHAVTAPLGAAAAHLSLDLERLGVGAATQEEELAKHGQALGAGLDQVKGEAATLPASISQIQQAAIQAGV